MEAELKEQDIIGIAYMQLHDETLRIDFPLFHKLVEKALGRPVFTHEFGLSANKLKAEIKEVFNKKLKEVQ